MTRGRAVCETIHLTALALWLGALVMTGATAAVVFPAMREAAPTLPAFAAYPGEHWSLAAGKVMQRVFLVCDAIQSGAATVAGATLVLLLAWFGLPRRRTATIVRAALLVGVTASFAVYFFLLAPDMNRSLSAFWGAAGRGELDAAARFKAEFDANHPRASAILSTNAVALVAAFVAAAWCAVTPVRPAGAPRATAPAPRTSARLEEPMLARVKR